MEDPEQDETFPGDPPARQSDDCRRLVRETPRDAAVVGVIWSAHFQDTCAAFGMENALMTMLAAPEMYRAVDRRIVDFYLRANEIFFEATRGYLDAILIGNDVGSQRNLMIRLTVAEYVSGCPSRRLIQQATDYGSR
jgi:uroporphyrinogen decarboxylase